MTQTETESCEIFQSNTTDSIVRSLCRRPLELGDNIFFKKVEIFRITYW